eukprot:3026231-Amphidinium_carterae.1
MLVCNDICAPSASRSACLGSSDPQRHALISGSGTETTTVTDKAYPNNSSEEVELMRHTTELI